ncbi:MAG: NYN domain-containing protein [Coriobacteriales bacterium]
MRYLIDGYNVTMSDPATAHLDVGEQRAALVRRIAVRGSALLGSGTITVVFDGYTDGAAEQVGLVGVRFSAQESADDVIARLGMGPDVTVVTSDSELAARVRLSGAHVHPSSRVFEQAAPRRKPHGRYPAASAGLPKGANRISEELKRIWLPDDKEE